MEIIYCIRPVSIIRVSVLHSSRQYPYPYHGMVFSLHCPLPHPSESSTLAPYFSLKPIAFVHPPHHGGAIYIFWKYTFHFTDNHDIISVKFYETEVPVMADEKKDEDRSRVVPFASGAEPYRGTCT